MRTRFPLSLLLAVPLAPLLVGAHRGAAAPGGSVAAAPDDVILEECAKMVRESPGFFDPKILDRMADLKTPAALERLVELYPLVRTVERRSALCRSLAAFRRTEFSQGAIDFLSKVTAEGRFEEDTAPAAETLGQFWSDGLKGLRQAEQDARTFHGCYHALWGLAEAGSREDRVFNLEVARGDKWVKLRSLGMPQRDDGESDGDRWFGLYRRLRLTALRSSIDPDLSAMLLEPFLGDSDPKLEAVVLAPLGERKSRKAFARCIAILAGRNDEKLRQAAVDGLVAQDSLAALEALMHAATGGDTDLRDYTAQALKRMQGDLLRPYFIRSLTPEAETWGARLAIELLGPLEGGAITAALQTMLRHEDLEARCNALRWLGRRGDESSVKPVTSLSKSRTPAVRMAALGAMILLRPDDGY